MRAVYVVETLVPNGGGTWLPIEPQTYRRNAWTRLRNLRGQWPEAKFRVTKYVPAVVPAPAQRRAKKGGA